MGLIKKVTAGSPILASEWNAVVDAASWSVSQRVRTGQLQQAISVLVRNDTGGDLNRYDTIALGEPIFEMQDDGSVDLIFIGVAADPAKPTAICTEPIEDERFGRAWIHGLALAYVAAGSTTATQANPTASGNILTPGSGPVRLLGAPSATETLLLPVLLGVGAGGGSKFSLRIMGTWSAKVVSCQIYSLDGATVVYKETADVYDPLSVFATLNIGDWQYCTFQDGKYYAADPGDCPGSSPLIADPPATQPIDEEA